jgi:bacillolysin
MLLPLCVALLAAPATFSAPPPDPQLVRLLTQRSGGAALELRLDARGHVALARGPLGALTASDPLQFLRARGTALGLRKDESLQLAHDERDEAGNRHLRISRSLHGVPVAFDQLRLHAGPGGGVYALEAETSDLASFHYAPPAFHPLQAVQLATGGYQGRFTSPPSTDLVIVGERLEGVTGSHLAYRVRVSFPARPGEVPVSEEVYLDAHTGAELGRLSQVFTAGTPITVNDTNLENQTVALNAAQYSDGIALQDLVTLQASGGQLFTLSGIAQTVYTTKTAGAGFGDPMAVNVADNVRKAIAFDLATFGWNKWNFNQTPSTAGGVLLGITHEGDHLANAFFTTTVNNGQVYGSMHYGDGDGNILTNTAACLDITGHEIGHGIVQGTAGLVYHNQSGAMNEHFADVFGWLLDPGNDTIGEGCTGPGLGYQPLRDLCHPAQGASPQPETMAQYVSSPDTDDGDHGGVHTNSGIPNKAACLFRNATDFATVGKVWFRALSQHLGPSAVFTDLVTATQTSCTELSLGSAACTALTNAWASVGLATATSGTTCPPNSSPTSSGQCACNAGYHVNAAQSGCDPDPAPTCPSHAHAVGAACYCDTGFAPDAAGTSCVPANSDAACGANAHVEGGACVCDECYQYNASKTGEGQSCTAIPGCAVCTDPLKVSQGGACVCEAGTKADSSGACQPVPGTCGNENYAGRCAGKVLIYCNEYDSAGNPLPASQISVSEIDCSKNTALTTCDISPVDGTFDCVAPKSNCGSVPATGACSGNTAQICDNGVLKTYDCGANGCSGYTYQGVPVDFCNLCPPHASLQSLADGGSACYCNAGYQVDSTGTACVAVSGADGGTGGGADAGPGGSSGSSGCASGGVGFPALLALLALAASRRRKA